MDTMERLTPVYLAFLRRIARMETPGENKDALDTMAGFIRDFAVERGFAVERIPFPATGDFLHIRLPGAPEEQPVLLMAHMDTVHAIGAFGPEVIREEDNWLCGPGVLDCKGGIATALMTMETLRESGCRRGVSLLLTSDEEISGRLSGEAGFALMRKYAAEACAVFNCEAGKEGELTVGRKGIVRLRVDVNGIAAHAGNAYFNGASAIREAASQILQIESGSSEDGCTFNCGVIHGGTTPNTVPGHCSFVVDIRAMKEHTLNEGVERVKCLAETVSVPGTSCTVTVVSSRPPMEHREANDALLEKINRSARAIGQEPLRPIVRGGGTDAAYTVQAGAPTVCSCGMVGTGEHTLRERVDMSSLAPRVALLSHTILSL